MAVPRLGRSYRRRTGTGLATPATCSRMYVLQTPPHRKASASKAADCARADLTGKVLGRIDPNTLLARSFAHHACLVIRPLLWCARPSESWGPRIGRVSSLGKRKARCSMEAY